MIHRHVMIAVAALIISAGAALADDDVKVAANCIVTHTGYRGTIVARGVSKPSGKIKKLVCNGKNIELESNDIADGLVTTKQFGDIGIRFGSMVATIGAGDFTSVQPGQTAQERVVELYVTAAKAAEFTAFVGK